MITLMSKTGRNLEKNLSQGLDVKELAWVIAHSRFSGHVRFDLEKLGQGQMTFMTNLVISLQTMVLEIWFKKLTQVMTYAGSNGHVMFELEK